MAKPRSDHGYHGLQWAEKLQVAGQEERMSKSSMYRPLSSLVPNAADLLALKVEELAGVLLVHVNSYDGPMGSPIYRGMIDKRIFFGSLSPNNPSSKAEYGDRQPEVNRALMEAWDWLESKGV